MTAIPLSVQKYAAVTEATMIVNTTSLGLHGESELPHDLGGVDKGALIVDIIYNPLETPFLKLARTLGMPTVDGLGMLIHQAVPGFTHWFGVEPPIDAAVREVLLK